MPHDITQQQMSGIRVLLVDDDPDSAEETAQLLLRMDSQLNIEYKTVELLADALTEIAQSHYDLILLDTGLADMPTPSAIRSLRDAFSYAPIIATLKYDDPDLAAMWVGEGADECLFMGVVDEKILNRVVQYAIKRYHTYSKLHEQSRTHHILNKLLSLSLQDLPFERLLNECLGVILSAPLAEMQHQGAIFVTENGSRQLKMQAHSNLDPQIVDLCKSIEFGQCLCGCAAESGELQFADCVDHRHENRVEGMQPHGHYNVPIVAKGEVLGVLVLYLKEGHTRSEEDEAFLRGVADTLAGIIERARTSNQLVLAHEQNSRLLSSLTSILIGVDNQDCISHWNDQAIQTFGVADEQVVGEPIASVPIGWDWPQVTTNILACLDAETQTDRFEVRYKPESGSNRLLSVCATPFIDESDESNGYLLIADDVTDQKQLESEMQQLQKLQSIGQLAAGIAHEINTPIQYVGDNVRFLRDAFEDIAEIMSDERDVVEKARSNSVSMELIEQLDEKIEAADLEYLQEEVPKSIQQTLDGVERVATIVRAMKEFSHPGSEEKTLTDINKAVDSTVTVARNVWKYHAEMQLELDSSLPQIRCIPGPINEVILNIIVNAAHAIADSVEDSGELGQIRITTGQEDDWVAIRIADSGTGIPEDVREHVFDPFFTTKDVGQGTGQGLSLSHRIIVEQHDGDLSFETEMGVGTTFIIKLPLLEEMA
ncbi:MAG: PAS domain S-box protein [Candidatus Thiodiazotropha sp. (ex Monitilora ramsayi)]|nr:PAS domain S-box protein [Candidatus Thiodiazotropha sp. (ex Monitilora ramsayi)]